MKKLMYTLLVLVIGYELIKIWLSIPIFNLMFIPFSFSMIGLIGFIAPKLLLRKVKQVTIQERKEQQQILKFQKEHEKEEFFRNYDQQVKPMYEAGKKLFAQLMKEKKMRHYQIKDLKRVIDGCLGVHVEYYHNYKFKNDAHEVYVKMKNFNLNVYDWERILTFLADVADNPDFKVAESHS